MKNLRLAAFLAFALVPAAPLTLSTAFAAEAAAQHALAPSGALRVGVYRGSPSSIIEGPTPQDAKGVGYDLGRELAGALGVRFEPVVFPANAPLLKALAAGEVDLFRFVFLAALFEHDMRCHRAGARRIVKRQHAKTSLYCARGLITCSSLILIKVPIDAPWFKRYVGRLCDVDARQQCAGSI